MKFLDLFAGIGGFRLGMEQAEHECVGHVEKDKFARMSYKAIHRPKETEFDREDITTVTDEEWRALRGTVDCICAGFPCQSFSLAGRRRGFEDTRGTMFFEVARATKQIQPRFLLLENVKGLLSHNNGQTFAVILSTLDELGYDAEWAVLNSKNFGVPQNRERVFIVGYLRGSGGREVFPLQGSNREIDIVPTQSTITITARYGEAQTVGTFVIEGKQDGVDDEPKILQLGRGNNKGGLHDISPTVTSNNFPSNNVVIQVGNIRNADYFGGNPQVGRVYSVNGISPCLDTMSGGGREPKIVIPVLTPERAEKRRNGRRMTDDGEEMFTITTQDRHGVFDGARIRKLTPRECFRLQGFPDWAFDRAKEAGISDSQLYKQAGNSVTVNVIREIGRRME